MADEAVRATRHRLTLSWLPMLAWVAWAAFPSAISAHRLDECLQGTLAVIEPDGVHLQINLMPGVAVAEQALALMDRDHDGAISPAEAAAYVEALKRDLTARVDERTVELKLTASQFPTPAELRTGWGIVQMDFSVVASGALAAGAHRFTLENRHLSAISVYLFNAAKPKSGLVEIISQKRNDNQSTGEIKFRLSSAS